MLDIRGRGDWKWGLTGKEQEGTLKGDGNILHLERTLI